MDLSETDLFKAANRVDFTRCVIIELEGLAVDAPEQLDFFERQYADALSHLQPRRCGCASHGLAGYALERLQPRRSEAASQEL